MIKTITILFMALCLAMLSGCGTPDESEAEVAEQQPQHSPAVKEPIREPIREPMSKELPDLAVILAAEYIADVYAVELPFTMSLQVMSPKVDEAARNERDVPEIALGTDEDPWWRSLRFSARLGDKTEALECEVFPETEKNALQFAANDYNTAIAVFQPRSEWKGREVEIYCTASRGAREFSSRPLIIDFSAPAPQQIEIDLARFHALVRNDDFDAARQIAEKYTVELPDDYQGFSMMAELNEETGDWEEAIKAYRRVISLLPENADHDAVQFILMRIKQLEERMK